MARFKVGDKVKVVAPKDWPKPPGFRLGNAVATVENWVDWPEAMDDFGEYIYVKIEKTESAGKDYVGMRMHFKEDFLKKA